MLLTGSHAAACSIAGPRRPPQPHWQCLGRLRALQHGCTRPKVVQQAASGGGLGDEDVDVAVFRFTLGIPGFEDRFIPRVVGAAGAALLVVNHVLGAQPAPAAQVRAEFVILALAVVSVLVPEIEERLKEALPGRGRQRLADVVEGAVTGLLLQPSLRDTVKQELAWSSVSLIRNTNSCGVVVVDGGQVVLARGALGAGAVVADKAASLNNMSKDLAALTSSAALSAVMSAGKEVSGAPPAQLYLPDRAAIASAGLGGLRTLPTGAQSVLVQSLPRSASAGSDAPSFMLVYSERARALSDKERKWVAAIGRKLEATL